MRLWSIHPQLLDRMGLLGLWREALCAQNILRGGPPYKGPYSQHPQLERFKNHPFPLHAIGAYLLYVYREGRRRGYKFNPNLIDHKVRYLTQPITLPRGQINYEIRLLLYKLSKRDKKKRNEVIETLLRLSKDGQPPRGRYLYSEINPVFNVNRYNNTVASWERPKEIPYV